MKDRDLHSKTAVVKKPKVMYNSYLHNKNENGIDLIFLMFGNSDLLGDNNTVLSGLETV